MKYSLLLLVLFAYEASQAAILSLQAGKDKINHTSVLASVSGEAKIAGQGVKLFTVGYGVRTKTIFNVAVYAGHLLVSDTTKFVRTDTGALASLDGIDTVALHMDFVTHRSTADKMVEAYTEGLEKNGQNPQSPALKALLAAVKECGDAIDGKSITIVGIRRAGKESIIYENAGKSFERTISGDPGFIKSVFSIWLGIPADGGLKTLKKDLISGKQSD